ncbi:hypothetical protein HYS94_03620 [Candidatus Daviesbacteria bacterium]|nr:hypothetical protein [Candidatus Daviesbacteria bacterium]
MQKGAQSKIIQTTDDDDKKLQQEISDSVNQMGHHSTPHSVHPDDQTPLKEIERVLGDAVHIMGATVGDEMSKIRQTDSHGMFHQTEDRKKQKQKWK